MQSTDIPVKFSEPFAYGAGAGYITTPVPLTTSSAGRASLTLGFPPTTFEPESSGGNPPWGADMNGALYQITAWIRWATAGGIPTTYDDTFAAAVGGYPAGALLQSLTAGHYWYNGTNNNSSNPDTGGAGWTIFPDVLIQAQAGNAALDTGGVNAFAVTLSPLPASLAAIKYAPIRVVAANANTSTTPTITFAIVGGTATVTMINSSGAALSVGQISRAGQIFEGYLDGTYFQVTSPPPGVAPAVGLRPGMILLCPSETPFSGTLECDGSTLLISSYSSLFGALGNRFGGDGITTFKLPDLRGEFVRGWDHGRGLDPNASTRTNSGNGTTGDHVGTNQNFQAGPINIANGAVEIDNPVFTRFGDGSDYMQAFTLASSMGDGTFVWGPNQVSPVPPTPVGTANQLSKITGSLQMSGNVGVETRPVNINLMYIIVY